MAMTVSFPGGKRVDVDAGGFVIHTDQSQADGGEGSAPDPFATFLASLAACAGIYVLGFCQVRGIPTEGLRLLQHHERDPATKKLMHVRLEIEMPPGFPPQYLSAVRHAASHCAVKRAMLAPPEFVTEARIGAAPVLPTAIASEQIAGTPH